ncbi:hypothetical protein N7448_003065 [Penicillium atrosanguineum]|uniref:Uncharacterized protein n=1 Tax=Penicillium atrosanguineum TaxID=1132637 RepID=A0A9W9H6N5_9EURO|nr:uncharacterized protein N7443_002041 [Penicillium atrosanguineum]KAJ5121932.1 hypothetical protein N7526_008869 [Penicillium atrosanguineum]KAJ5139657.1 hypothetical protein N7448_003065 [Penicillium atrosanguineum]KAJ5309580.1 hypothetical protein N7443_002041 [Penicillium atrosanguineum]KAJ5315099.1 hypothetical protein N7476_005406 [Penicillium atrosanguineum]
MGHKFSVVGGVKSENFYQQGNAINEIWLGDVEIISRLPFGDSDLEQSGWPAGGWPKIPWHQFIIPLKRDLHTITNSTMSRNTSLDCYAALQAEHDLPIACLFSSWSESLVVFFGALFTCLGFMMAFVAAKQMAEASKALSRWSRIRVQVIPREYLPSIVKRLVRVYAGLGALFTVVGFVAIFMGIPMLRHGLRGLSANRLIAWISVSLIVIIGFEFIWKLITLLANLRRTLMALRRPLSEDPEEKPDPALNIITADEFDDRYLALSPCPECEKRSLFD